MDKNKITEKLNEFFGDKTVRVFMPKQFLANLSDLLTKQNKVLVDQVKANNVSPELIEETKKTQDLLVELKKAIQENKVDKVEVSNLKEYPKPEKFPEIKIPEQKEIKIPEFPKEIDIKEPIWYEKIQNKLIGFIADAVVTIKKSFASDLDRHKEAKNALAVRLVTANGDSFYNAMFSGGGCGTTTTGGGDASAANQATMIALLTTIDADTSTMAAAVVGGEMNVNIATDSVGIGGGTQYTEGDTDASITGTAILWEDTSDTLRSVSAVKPLPVTVTGGGDASAANQTTLIGHVDGIEALLGTIDADTSVLAGTDFATEAKQDDIITAISGIAAGGDATAANQTTIISHVDGIEGLLGTIDTDTGNIDTKLGTIDADTGAIKTSVELIDDIIATDDTTTHTPGSTKGAIIMAVATPTDTEVDADDFGALRMTTDRRMTTEDTHTNDIKAAVEAIQAGQLSDGHNVTVDNASIAITVASLPLPTGAATSANQQTDALTDTELRATPVPISGSVTADLGANNDVTVTSGAITETNSGAIKTAVETIDNAISGSEMQVDVVAPLPAGTNAIGKLAANSGVDIGDVDVTSLPSVTIGTNTDSIDGAGAPSIDSYASKAVNLAAATANQEVIAAPGASKQIWVYGLVGTADVAGTISIQDEDDTALSGVMPVAETGGFVMNPSGNFAMPWIKVATNKALEIDTLVCAFDGVITYAIVSI